jgi:hypothetical protein
VRRGHDIEIKNFKTVKNFADEFMVVAIDAPTNCHNCGLKLLHSPQIRFVRVPAAVCIFFCFVLFCFVLFLRRTLGSRVGKQKHSKESSSL